MQQIKVVLDGFEEELSTRAVCNLAIEKAHKSPSVKEWKNFIEEFVYLGNSHLLIVEELIENGFGKQAKNYFKALLEFWMEDYENKDEMIDEVFVPMSFGMEGYERNISFKEWIKKNNLEKVLKEIK